MSRGLIRRWRERGGRALRLVLLFDDIMEFALALLSVSPAELEALGWTFADRKRLLDHLLAAGRVAQGTPSDGLPKLPVELAIPATRCRSAAAVRAARTAKAAGNAAMLDRVLASLNAASHRRTDGKCAGV